MNFKNFHALKTINPHFQDLKKGVKNFEARKNDRDFKVDDKLLLLEYDSEKGYSGKALTYRVSHILSGEEYGIKEGYVIMSLEPGNDIEL